MAHKSKSLPLHLYVVTALPSKTHILQVSTLHVWFIDVNGP